MPKNLRGPVVLLSLTVAGCTAIIGSRDVFQVSDRERDLAAPNTQGSDAANRPGPDDATARGPQLCRSDATVQALATLGDKAVIFSLSLNSTHVFFGNASGDGGTGLYRVAKGGGAVTRMATKEGVENVLAVGDRVYFTSTESGGSLWSCPIEGECTPTSLGSSKDPVALSTQDGQFYFQDTTIARAPLLNAALGQVTKTPVRTSRAFLVDKEDVFYLKRFDPPASYGYSLFQNRFGAADDAGVSLTKFAVPAMVDGSASQEGSLTATWSISQSQDYVFWGASGADTRRGAVIREPKKATGNMCIYGGVRADSRPYAVAYYADHVFWSNTDVPTRSVVGSIECCPVEGRCCPADPSNPEPESAPTKMVKAAQGPTGLAVDDSGVYFASVTSGTIFRIPPM